MDSFTEAYGKARSVVQSQKFEAEWTKFLSTEVKLNSLLAADGPDPLFASGLDKLRAKILKEAEGKRGEAILAACKTSPATGSSDERASTLKLLWHLYRSSKRGGQDVWIYSPPKDFATWIYAEIAGAEASYKDKLEKTTEVYSEAEREVMCDALGHALAATQKACVKLSAPDATTTATVKSWFAEENTTDDQIKQAIKTLLEGYKKLSDVLNSTTLVFSDEPLDRNAGGWKDWAFVRPTEKMNVVYIQGAFLKAAGSTGRLWICVETIIHEVSHRVLGTTDHQYDYKGLKPSKTGLTFDKALQNADTWGYFCVDLVGMLSDSDRTKTLKVA
ncbi:M35 family metallo-endopeptidase [Methylomonas albis]|uniref:Lysine-specific metallo-endopeptidase domain-containing protein n=1 Tax=Methylomonas albis TaxID=1854563 RepID=A0ABR9D5J9_9GAMM|nr:M35 family metallo-endopeptidase [Methylomonas albis]MBD9358061.1 hypothetical protein [Methylomonas albis]